MYNIELLKEYSSHPMREKSPMGDKREKSSISKSPTQKEMNKKNQFYRVSKSLISKFNSKASKEES